MNEYIPVQLNQKLRRQAIHVWLFTGAVILAWLGLILAAPAAELAGFDHTASWIYRFYSNICHQIPERTFHIGGQALAVCSRCFGVYFGLLLGVAAYPLWRSIEDIEPISRAWLIVSLIPISIDWALTFFGIWENTHVSRFLTGTILGAACATFIIPAVVEIARNLTLRRRAKMAA